MKFASGFFRGAGSGIRITSLPGLRSGIRLSLSRAVRFCKFHKGSIKVSLQGSMLVLP